MLKQFHWPLVALMVLTASPAVAAETANTTTSQTQEEQGLRDEVDRLKRDVIELQREARENAERWAQQAIEPIRERLWGEERVFSDAYTRATKLHAHIAAGYWDDASKDVKAVREKLNDVATRIDKETPAVSKSIRDRFVAMKSLVASLETQVKNKDKNALKSADVLVDLFNATTTELATTGWWGTQGGGAGR